MKTTPLGVEQYNWWFGERCEVPDGVWGEAPALLAISPLMALNRAFLRTLKMVFNYIILANFNKTDTVYVVLL